MSTFQGGLNYTNYSPSSVFINTCNDTNTPTECFYNFNMAHCQYGYYTGWMDMIYCITPLFWGYLGLAAVLGLSIAGAAW